MFFSRGKLLTLLFVGFFFVGYGQLKYFDNPLKIPASLSGNFGELRPNHFHTGIDLRTQQKTGLPVFSSAEGFVSRIVISPNGYGKALYVEHSNSTTTLYGHLERFRDDIEAYVRSEQYKRQSYAIDIEIPPGKFKVARQEQIAFSGNSGSSGGPHLHFEIRDTKTQDALNPLLLNNFNLKDKTAPKIVAVELCPLSKESNVELTARKKSVPVKPAGSTYQLNPPGSIRAYGKIGIAVKASDYFDANTSPCGVYSAQLLVNGEKVYGYTFSRIPFDQNRYLNSHIDYETFVKSGSRYQKLWRDPGNRFYLYETNRSGGVLDVDSGKVYECEIILSDVMGNKSKLDFKISGKYIKLPMPSEKKENLFNYDSRNKKETDDFELNAPPGAFYKDFYFRYSTSEKIPGFYSRIHRVHSNTTPIHKPVKISIKTDNFPIRLADKAVIVSVDAQGKKTYVGGTLSGEWITANIMQFGNFGVTCDTIPPSITSLGIKNKTLTEPNRIRFRITDNLSGIMSYKGLIDDEWALFEYDQKSATLVYTIDKERLTLNQLHSLELTVTDKAGNSAVYKASFRK